MLNGFCPELWNKTTQKNVFCIFLPYVLDDTSSTAPVIISCVHIVRLGVWRSSRRAQYLQKGLYSTGRGRPMASLHHQSPGKENLFPRLARFLYFLPFCFFGFLRSLLGRTDGRTDIWCWLVLFFLFCCRPFGFTSAAIKEKQKRLIFYISQAYFIPYYSLPFAITSTHRYELKWVWLAVCVFIFLSNLVLFKKGGVDVWVGRERKRKEEKRRRRLQRADHLDWLSAVLAYGRHSGRVIVIFSSATTPTILLLLLLCTRVSDAVAFNRGYRIGYVFVYNSVRS